MEQPCRICLTFNLCVDPASTSGPPLPVKPVLFLPVTATLCIHGLQTTERHVMENDVKNKKKNEDEVTSHLLVGEKKLHVKNFVQVLKYNR